MICNFTLRMFKSMNLTLYNINHYIGGLDSVKTLHSIPNRNFFNQHFPRQTEHETRIQVFNLQ